MGRSGKEELKNELPEKRRQMQEEALGRFVQPLPKKESKQLINCVLTSVILSLSAKRMKVVRTCWDSLRAKPDISQLRDLGERVLLDQSDTLAVETTKLRTLSTPGAEKLARSIESLIERNELLAERLARDRNLAANIKLLEEAKAPDLAPAPAAKPAESAAPIVATAPYVLPCGHKVGGKYFSSHARRMKERIPFGPLQFKCPHDCGYIMDDRDLAALLGGEFRAITANYGVFTIFLSNVSVGQ